MTLPSQILQFPFRSGLSEGVDPKQAPPGTLMRALNVVWTKTGRAEKRPGTLGLTTTSGPAAGKRLFARGSDLCVVDGSALFAYSTNTAKWRNVGRIPNLGSTWTTLTDTLSGVQSADAAVSSTGDIVEAWVSGDPIPVVSTGALSVQITNANGTAVLPPRLIAASGMSGVRVLIIGTTAIIVALQPGAPGIMFAWTINLTTYAVSAFTLLNIGLGVANSGVVPQQGWDACVVGTNFVLAYNEVGPLLTLRSYNVALALQATGGITTEVNGCSAVAIDGTVGETLYVVYSTTVATPRPIRIATANPATLVEVVAPVTIEAPPAGSFTTHVGVCRLDATNCIAMFRMYEGTFVARTMTYKVANTGVVDITTQRGTWWGIPLSRPFMANGRCYLTMVDAAGDTATIKTPFLGFNTALVEAETSTRGAPVANSYVPHRYIGKIEALLGGVWHMGGPLPGVTAVGSAYFTAQPFQATPATRTALGGTSNWRQGVRLLRVTEGTSVPGDMWRTIAVGPEAYVSGAGLTAYDGATAFSYGFARGPFVWTLTTNPVGVGVVADGTYLYGGVEEYRSNAGILHRSPATTGASVTAAGGGTSTNTVTFGGWGLAAKGSLGAAFGAAQGVATLLATYRTIVDGTVYQRLTYEPGFAVTIVNETLSTQAPPPDTRNDNSIDGLGTTLASRSALYTEGGILNDEQPPVGNTMFLHKSRLWTLVGDQRTWWYSKSFQDDLGVAPGFSPSFRIVFDEPQVCGASMDDKAVFFSVTSIAILQGEGPGPNGQNSDYGTPSRIQTDSGCTNPRSVVSMPDGIMFEGAGDIYILTRQLEVEWIGRPVMGQLAAFPIITSAVLLAHRNEVRFSCNSSTGAEATGIVLVYNYVEKQWSTFTYAAGAVASTAIADACLWQGLYTFLTPLGKVFQEDPTTYLDGGTTWVTMDVETAEIYAEGPLSYQLVRRAYLKGDLLTQCDVTVQVAIGGSATYEQTHLWRSSEMVTIGSAKIGVHVRRQKSDSIRVRITDAAPTSSGFVLGTGQGLNLSALGFDIAPIQGLDRRTSGARK